MVLKLINKLREHRIPFILNSYNVPDVFSLADRLAVMRRGHKATEKRISETSSDEVVRYMVGTVDDSRAVREMV
jgi:simple sugar transport system ATP-binding protein